MSVILWFLVPVAKEIFFIILIIVLHYLPCSLRLPNILFCHLRITYAKNDCILCFIDANIGLTIYVYPYLYACGLSELGTL